MSAKNPTRQQLALMQGKVATPSDWLITKVKPDEIHLIHRYVNQTKIIWI